MENYSIKDFKYDILTTREFDIIYKNKLYSLTNTKDGFIFTDVKEKVYAIFDTYNDLLKSIRIDGFSIAEIIAEKLYDDLSIY